MSESDSHPPTRSDVIREVDWGSIAPWFLLFRVPGVAISHQVILFAILGALLTGDYARESISLRPYGDNLLTENGPVRFVQSLVEPCAAAFNTNTEENNQWSSTLVGAWRVGIWSFFGLGAVIAAARALTYSAEQSTTDILKETAGRWPMLLGAIGLALLVLVIPTLALWLAGAVLNWPLIGWVAALLWPLAILIGVAVGVLALGAVAGAPLMWAAIGIEPPDPFDAASRMYAYVFQRLARLVCYVAVVFVIGLLLSILVELLVWASLGSVHQVVGTFPDNGAGAMAARWEGLFLMIVRAIYPAYFFTSATAIYLLLRRDVDGQAIDEMA